ncbi:hypothetical protein ACWEGQ_33520, partial [Streptomyces seoulensis]
MRGPRRAAARRVVSGRPGERVAGAAGAGCVRCGAGWTGWADGAGDPRVGMIGGSYGGAVQLAAAAVDHRID